MSPRRPRDITGVYDAALERITLNKIVARHYETMLRSVHGMVESATGKPFDLTPEARELLLKDAASRVAMIDETTRKGIRDRLVLGADQGYTAEEMGESIDELFDKTWKNRGATIARTEMQHAMVIAAQDRFGAAGIKRMQIRDGVDHDDPCRARNGKVVPVGEVVDLNHPNCQLVLSPILEDEDA